jgi:sulfur relay (sulfurtransferase) complex TusBCD TusD component (DsrE family)
MVLNMRRHWFVNMMGAPYESESTTTLFRLVDSLLRAEQTATIWTCGGATLLTLVSLTQDKPDDLFDAFEAVKKVTPTTARLVQAYLARWPERCRWLVCKHCAAERGALEHVPGVRMISALGFRKEQRAADRTIVLGRK